MYRIIGADGREYGPISPGQVREWVAEGRLNAQTQATAEGGGQWKPLGEYQEFALLFSRIKPPLPAPGPIAFAPAHQTNSMALTSLIMGILSVSCGLCCCHGFPFNVLGIVFSLVALAQIRDEPRFQQSRSLAIAGLALSVLSLLLAFFIAVLGFALGMADVARKWHPI
jgi:hypothetical protein